MGLSLTFQELKVEAILFSNIHSSQNYDALRTWGFLYRGLGERQLFHQIVSKLDDFASIGISFLS